MLTRAKARAANQHVFVDDKWNDAYIQTKDEQIEMLHAQRVLKSWEDDEDSELETAATGEGVGEGEGGEVEEEDEDRWISDDSDDEDADEANAADVQRKSKRSSGGSVGSSALAGGSFVENALWTAAAASVAPVVVYGVALRCFPSARRRKSSSWPLQSRSFGGTLVKAYTNVLSIAILLVVAAWGVCGDFVVPHALRCLRWRLLSRRVDACATRFLDDWRDVAVLGASALVLATRKLQQLVLRSALLAVVAWLLLSFHRLWLKSVVLLTTAGALSVQLVAQLRAEQRSSIEIASLDPNFAFANESIFIAIDGQNLEQGATVAWVPYWGVLQHLQAYECDKLFPQPLRNGGVRVAFDQLNEFVPCYAARGHDDDFKCFEQLRLRVKDPKSVPGWSLYGSDSQALGSDEL